MSKQEAEQESLKTAIERKQREWKRRELESLVRTTVERKQRSELESFVKTTMNNENDYFVKEISDEYGQRFTCMVQNLEISKRTITSGLKIISKELLLDPYGFYHVLTFLVFCMVLDKHCQIYSWYNHKELVDSIVSILYDAKFIPPPSSAVSLNICTIL